MKLIALLSSVLTAGLSIWVVAAFDKSNADFQFVSMHTWIKPWGISWHLGIDGISLFLVLLTGVLFPLVVAGTDPHHDHKRYLSWMLLLEAGLMGSFISLDLFLFFVFFEIVLVPMYFLIAGWGYEGRVYAATKFFLFTMVGSAFMFVGITATAFLAKGSGPLTFDLIEMAKGRLLSHDGTLVVLRVRCRVRGQGPDVPVAHVAARRPYAGADGWFGDPGRRDVEARYVRLAALRRLPVSRGRAVEPDLFLTLAVIGIIYGAIAATMQTDLKRLVAYSSVAHLGLHRARHVRAHQPIDHRRCDAEHQPRRITGALFFLVGMIYDRRHTREISELKGLQKVAPIFAGVFMVVMLSSIGVPGLNGFVGEYLVLIGSFAHRAMVDRRRCNRCHSRRAVPAVGVPTGVPRRARRRQQELPRLEDAARAPCCCLSSA